MRHAPIAYRFNIPVKKSYSTDQTNPNRKQTTGLLSVFAQGMLWRTQGWPQEDIESRPQFHKQALKSQLKNEQMSLYWYLEYRKDGLKGDKKKSGVWFNRPQALRGNFLKSRPGSVFGVCFGVKMCLVGTDYIYTLKIICNNRNVINFFYQSFKGNNPPIFLTESLWWLFCNWSTFVVVSRHRALTNFF